MHVWDSLPFELQGRIEKSTYVYPRYLLLAMGHSHSVHMLMSINITAAGRALNASRRLLGDVSVLADEDIQAPAVTVYPALDASASLDHGSIFEASMKSVCDDEESTAPSISEGSCGDVFDDGREQDHADESWREMHLSRSGDVSYSKSSTGQSLDKWLETFKGLRQGPERVCVAVHYFSGERHDGDMEEWIGKLGEAVCFKVHVTSADLAERPEWDLASSRICDWLMEAIELGLVDIIICGPPCSIWSAARWIQNGMGVRPVRVRVKFAWGVPKLRPGERDRVRMANDCATNALIFCEAVSSRGGGHLWEHPRDRG